MRKTILTTDKSTRHLVAKALRGRKGIDSVTLYDGALRRSDSELFSSLFFMHTLTEDQLDTLLDKLQEKSFLTHDMDIPSYYSEK